MLESNLNPFDLRIVCIVVHVKSIKMNVWTDDLPLFHHHSSKIIVSFFLYLEKKSKEFSLFSTNYLYNGAMF